MGLSAEVLLVREAVVGAVQAAWAGVKVTTESPEKGLVAPFAVVRVERLGFDFESPAVDLVDLVFEIVGRFGHGAGPVSDDRFGRAEALRDELMALGNAGGVSFSGLVKEIQLSDAGPVDDDFFDVRATYVCRMMTGR